MTDLLEVELQAIGSHLPWEGRKKGLSSPSTVCCLSVFKSRKGSSSVKFLPVEMITDCVVSIFHSVNVVNHDSH